MKLRVFTASIADNVGQPFNDVLQERLTNSILASRVWFLRRDYEKTKMLPESAIFEIRCIELIDVDATECCDSNIKLGCTVRRTKYKIPDILYLKDQISVSFKYVGSPDRSQPSFAYILPEQIPYLTTGKFIKQLPRFTYINGYIYVFNTLAKEITTRAAFSDLLQLKDFCGANAGGCLFDADNINIEDHYVDLIKQLVYTELGLKGGTKDEQIKINE